MKKQMTDNEFDSLVRQKIEQINTEVPTDLWDGIDAAINKTANPVVFPVKMPFAGIAAVITSLVFVIGLTVYFTSGKTSEISQTKTQKTAVVQQQKVSAECLETTATSTLAIPQPEVEGSLSTQATSAKLPIQNKKTVGISSQVNPAGTTENIISASSTNVVMPESNQLSEKQDATKPLNEDISTEVGNIEKENVSVKDSLLIPSPLAQTLAINPSATEVATTQNSTEETEKKTDASEKAKKTATKSDVGKRFYLQASLAPAYTYRSNTGNSGSYPQSYFDGMESGAFGWTVDISGKYKVNEQLYINGGFSLESYALKMHTDVNNLVGIPSEEEDDEDEIENYRLMTSMANVIIYTGSDDPISGTVDMSSQRIYITFSAGVDYYFYRHYFITGGVDYSLLLSYDNAIQLNSVNIKNTVSDISQDNWGLHIGLGREIPLSPKFSLMVYPELKWRFGSLISNQNFTAMPYSIGLHLGLKF